MSTSRVAEVVISNKLHTPIAENNDQVGIPCIYRYLENLPKYLPTEIQSGISLTLTLRDKQIN